MKTLYIPHGGMGGVGLEFERLELHRTCLIQQIALSHLFSWNYATKLTPIRDELVRNYRERYSLRSSLEMLVAALVACLALCACGKAAPPARELSRPEVEALFSDPEVFTVSYVYEQEGTGKLVIVAQRSAGK